VIFRQFVDDGLGCASYLIGDENEGTAVVVDPAYAIEQYLEEAAHRHVRLTGALETHTHADHLSGHGRLALEHGAVGRVGADEICVRKDRRRRKKRRGGDEHDQAGDALHHADDDDDGDAPGW
jgi:glyoxylase-like metal-dependent hydrolase (beta-lactamase superfamily II)